MTLEFKNRQMQTNNKKLHKLETKTRKLEKKLESAQSNCCKKNRENWNN